MHLSPGHPAGVVDGPHDPVAWSGWYVVTTAHWEQVGGAVGRSSLGGGWGGCGGGWLSIVRCV